MRDFEAWAVHMASERTIYEDGPFTRKQSWDNFAGGLGQWVLLGYGCWAIEEKATRHFVGVAGVNRPIHYPEDELGWTLVAQAEGRGIAFEAATAAREYARTHQGITELVSYIDPDNARSIRLAQRLGAELDPNAATPDNDLCLVYRHPKVAA